MIKNKKLSLLFIFLLLSDQLVKFIVKNSIQNPVEVISGFFQINYVKNYGISFSMFSNQLFYIITISLLAIIYIIYALNKFKSYKYISLFLTIILAGAVGNFIDRLFYGFVVDYFDFKIFGFNFAVFNLADVFIVCSTIALFIYVYFIEKDIK